MENLKINDFFRFFVRKLYKDIDLSNEDLDEMAVDFERYLFDIVGEEKGRSWYPESLPKLILQHNHPFKTEGFEPALVLHFCNYVEKGAKEYQAELDEHAK